VSVQQDVTAICKNYLGPAAEQFIAKQCQMYLKIAPTDLTRAHLSDLAMWVDVAGTRYMDAAKSKELAAKIARC
jgi:hypothetical protein